MFSMCSVATGVLKALQLTAVVSARYFSLSNFWDRL